MIFSINKPKGWTSFDVVKKIKHITQEKRVGHGGTLDPFATGVLVIGTGKDTKTLQDISHSDKTYEALLKLGETTDTLDPEGIVQDRKTIPDLTIEQIQSVLNSFLGDQSQVPPMYSAKRIKGVRLYKLARKNIVVKREPVQVSIKEISCLEFNTPYIRFSVTCSKGTYIRVLGQDIAKSLNTVGYLTELTRTRVGDFYMDNAQSMKNFEQIWTSIVL